MESLSPLDSRYRDELRGLHEAFSEEALIRYRARVEVLYLKFILRILGDLGIVKRPSDEELDKLGNITLTREDVEEAKALEGKLGHDVKALEHVLRARLSGIGLGNYARLVHIGLTSEDVNNLAYGLMMREAIYTYLAPSMAALARVLVNKAMKYSNVPMLARTHGQPATPTTMGKELAYHAYRLCGWLDELAGLEFVGKVSGATGSYAAFRVIADLDWPTILGNFVKSLGFRPALASTQIAPPDNLAHVLTMVGLSALSLVNLAQDLWMYTMLGYIRFSGRLIGSSTMPHKVNPVDLENAEGNLKLGSSILMEISRIIQVSRLQRDLSDSTVKRNIGVGIGHVLLGVERLRRFIEGMDVDEEAMLSDLDRHWEVLSEAVQVRLRLMGIEDAYYKALELFRGRSMDKENYEGVLKTMGIEDHVIRSLTPRDYVGYASAIVKNVEEYCTSVLRRVEERCGEETKALSLIKGQR